MKKKGFTGESYKGLGVATVQLDAIANIYQPVELTLPLQQCSYPNAKIYVKITPKFIGEVIIYIIIIILLYIKLYIYYIFD
jgi:hypothetical protein